MSRRPILAVIGIGETLSADLERLSLDIGARAIEAGFRVCTGGLGGVMSAVCRGARGAQNYREGDTLVFLPGESPEAANEWADVVIPTGLGIARNVLVVRAADIVVAIGGGAGTLSEIAMAWQLGRPVIAVSGVDGWSSRLAGLKIDDRRGDAILEVSSAKQAVSEALLIWQNTSNS